MESGLCQNLCWNLRHFIIDWGDLKSDSSQSFSACEIHISLLLEFLQGTALNFTKLQNHFCSSSPVIWSKCGCASCIIPLLEAVMPIFLQRKIALVHWLISERMIEKAHRQGEGSIHTAFQGDDWLQQMNSQTAPDCQPPLRFSNLHNLNDLNTSGHLG